MAELKLQRMTADEFLEWQNSQDQKYELIDGLPVLPQKAMTRVPHAHDRVAVNIIRELASQLRRKPFKTTTDSIAIKSPAGRIRRPDVAVECGNVSLKAATAVEPRLVVEVLSPGTMNFDRFRKLDDYKSVETLDYILLVDTEGPRTMLHVRAHHDWILRHTNTLDAIVDLPAIECRLAARDVFEGLPFED